MGMIVPPSQFTRVTKEEPAYDVDAPFLNTEDTCDSTQELSQDTQSYDLQDNHCVEIRVQDDTGSNEEDIAQEVLQYLQQLQEQGVDNENVKVIYIQNGQIVGITDGDSNVDESRGQGNVGEHNEQERDSRKEICTQQENVIVEKLISKNDNVVDRLNVLKEPMTDVNTAVKVEDSKESDKRSNVRNAL